jgi:CHAD domain-containing protein
LLPRGIPRTAASPMPLPPTFEIPAPLEPTALLEALGEGWSLVAESPGRRRTECADSFDWRLQARGLRLLLVSEGEGRYWTLCPRDGELLVVAADGELPAAAGDLPAGPLREALAGLLAPRVLLARAAIEARVRRWRLIDAEGKTVLRLAEEQGLAIATEGPHRLRVPLPRRVRVQPLKGYDELGGMVAAQLELRFGAQPLAGCDCEAACRALGVAPGGYSSKIRVSLTPDLPGAEAARRIHLHLLGTLEANVPGTRAGLDPEFLHDLRVAVRRTRSALTQIRGVFPDERVRQFREAFGWMGEITGPMRDLDVFLLQFPDYHDGLPADLRGDLGPFRDFLLEERRRAHEQLARRLAAPHFRGLLKEWRAFLEAAPDPEPAPEAATPVGELANRRIWRAFRRVIRDGRTAVEAPSPEVLHELRKDCKKLRYLQEFFASLYPPERLDPLIKALKGLLDVLGEHQDLAVQAQHLEGFAERMAAAGHAPTRTLLALGALVAGLLARQVVARAAFAARFEALDSEANRAAYRALFKPAPGAAA